MGSGLLLCPGTGAGWKPVLKSGPRLDHEGVGAQDLTKSKQNRRALVPPETTEMMRDSGVGLCCADMSAFKRHPRIYSMETSFDIQKARDQLFQHHAWPAEGGGRGLGWGEGGRVVETLQQMQSMKGEEIQGGSLGA